ncbi:ABC transporter ATP-binding protein [Gordonia neofelifaecis]|uniref:ABC transporter permease/ATP-binding protein n=1 Tax=Gordonia neofelifaecis NRRL B-59395 TaxID=644548 RepID=F1YG47_9ACTN|nr:ABC transporter ATP-binding protein [Gordonia neofelifaecis]EGD56020.1 ABC transporter permease/ATP-binding protein [Gordonia neofelifaecis NRRL B-59395]
MKLLRGIREFRRFLGADRRLVFALLLAVVAALATVSVPYFLARITDVIFAGVVSAKLPAGITHEQAVEQLRATGQEDLANIAQTSGAVPGTGIDWSQLGPAPAVAVVAIVVVAVSRISSGLLVNTAVQRAIRGIRERVERKIHRLPLTRLEGRRRGEVLNAMTVDVDNLATVIGPLFVQLPVLFLTVIAVAVALLLLSPFFALIAFATIPVTAGVAVVVLRYAKPHMERQWRTTASITAHVEDVYGAHDMIAAYDGHRQTTRQFDELNRRLEKATRSGQAWSGSITPVLTFCNAIVFVVIAVLGALKMLDGAVTLGTLQAVVMYTQQLAAPMSELTSTMPKLQSGFISFGRVRQFLASTEESAPAVDDAPVDEHARHRLPPTVSFRGVRFAYDDGAPVLHGVDLELPAGRTTALVGATGSGKTTLTGLLQRFVDPTGGRILIDGEDIADMSRSQVRSQMAVVAQDPWLFTGTAGENIDYGVQHGRPVDDDMIESLLSGLPSGRDTEVSGDTGLLSDGEKQLITVARALAADPHILILDEATSAADPRTELVIGRGLEALRNRTTTLIVTHRYSTLATADSIAVLADGRIIEQGTARELLAAGGEFARLYGSPHGAADPA